MFVMYVYLGNERFAALFYSKFAEIIFVSPSAFLKISTSISKMSGGKVLNTVPLNMSIHGRIAACRMISQTHDI